MNAKRARTPGEARSPQLKRDGLSTITSKSKTLATGVLLYLEINYLGMQYYGNIRAALAAATWNHLTLEWMTYHGSEGFWERERDFEIRRSIVSDIHGLRYSHTSIVKCTLFE
jgi:hypothetical protein